MTPKLTLLTFLLTISILEESQGTDCVYTSPLDPSLVFDLNPAKNYQFYGKNGTSQLIYYPCRNDVKCSNLGTWGMAQVYEGSTSTWTCGYPGMWDANVQPDYNPDDGSWTFKFANGGPIGGCQCTTFVSTWFCDPSKSTRLVFFSFFSLACEIYLRKLI